VEISVTLNVESLPVFVCRNRTK